VARTAKQGHDHTIDAAAQWSLDREKGAREGLKRGRPASRSSNTLNTGTDPQNLFCYRERHARNPKIAGVLSLECCLTPAAGTWVEPTRRPDKVKVVGFDLIDRPCSSSTRRYQRPSTQAPEKQGFAAVRPARQILKRAADRQRRTPG